MIRFLLFLAIVGGLAFCGSTVKLGNRTFFGHVRAIWATEEVRDLTEGVKEKAGPAADRMKKGVAAGYKAMTEDGDKATTEDSEKAGRDGSAGPDAGVVGSGAATARP